MGKNGKDDNQINENNISISVVNTTDIDVSHQTKVVINSIKYLKKAIKRLPKDIIDDVNRRRLFSNYNELVDIIIEHIS